MARSFSELWAAIPKPQRTDGTKVMVALLVLGAMSPRTSVPVSQVSELLKVKLRGQAPKNVPGALRKAEPGVEAHGLHASGLRWSLTGSGVSRLERLTSLSLAMPSESASSSYFVTNLHPEVQRIAEPLLAGRHFAEAVGRAMKALNMRVRERTGRTADEGVRMMMQVFSTDGNGHKRLLLGPMTHEWEQDRQGGFRFLMAGAQQGIANVDKHGHLAIPTQEAAAEMLALISFLMRQVDGAELVD